MIGDTLSLVSPKDGSKISLQYLVLFAAGIDQIF